MGIHNICIHKEMDKKYTGCNLKATEWLVCVLIGVCAVIRSSMVDICYLHMGRANLSPIQLQQYCSCLLTSLMTRCKSSWCRIVRSVKDDLKLPQTYVNAH